MITGRGGTASAGWRGNLSPGMPGHLSPFAGSFGPRGCQSGEQPHGNVAVAVAARLKGEALCPGHDLREAAWGVGVRKKDWGSSRKSNIPFQVPRNRAVVSPAVTSTWASGLLCVAVVGVRPGGPAATPSPIPDSWPHPGCSLPRSILSPGQLRSPDRTQLGRGDN